MAEENDHDATEDEDDGSSGVELFVMFRRLRKCRRCGHYPCFSCIVWCDVLYIHDEGEPKKPCPCYADDCKCWWTYDDVECNKEVFQIFTKMCKELEKNGAVITGDSTTEDGRMIAIGYYMEVA